MTDARATWHMTCLDRATWRVSEVHSHPTRRALGLQANPQKPWGGDSGACLHAQMALGRPSGLGEAIAAHETA